jgi:hypothetical protein
MIVPATVIYDDGGRRLLVLQDHPTVDPWGGTMYVTGAWTFSDAGMWTTINEDLGRCCASASWSGVDDRERRRSLLVQGGSLGGIDLRPGHEGEQISVDAGIMAHDVLAATFDTSRGQILATAETGLASMAVRDGESVWVDADGAATWPSSTPPGHSIVYDAGGDRVVLFGGTDPSTTTETNVVRTLDRTSATPAWVTATTSGTVPAARTWHSAIADAATRTMFIVGGYRIEGGTTVVDLDDVAALDLATMTWRPVVTMPVGRTSPLLRMVGTDLYVLFGERHTTPGDPYTTEQLFDGYRICTVCGSVEPLTFAGDRPTVSSRALTGLDLPSAYVVLSPEATGVEALTATFAFSTITFARSAACEDPHGFGYGPGVVDPTTGVGYAVGDSVWEIRE